jgi:predicted amidophosphoribosyltransferase
MTKNDELNKEGWICPKCKSSVSPVKSLCPNCEKKPVDESTIDDRQVLLG